jgi:hypothetical protein
LKSLQAATQAFLANRTEIVELYRSAMFSLCQFHMNGAIEQEEMGALFRVITLKSLDKAKGDFAPGINAAADKLPSGGSAKEESSTGRDEIRSKGDSEAPTAGERPQAPQGDENKENEGKTPQRETGPAKQ